MGTNKSRPTYQTLRIDPAGRAHLLVTEFASVPEDALDAAFAHADTEYWVVGVSQPGIAMEPGNNVRAFRSVADLCSNLSHRLAREPVGLRLYAVGSEAFLWDIANLAGEAGLGAEEVFLNQAGTLRRRVYCTHCKSMNENVTANIVACWACGASLFVRDHFSRRLAAFMGVKVDAEVPGEIPEIELLYP